MLFCVAATVTLAWATYDSYFNDSDDGGPILLATTAVALGCTILAFWSFAYNWQ
jgi:hypothetical protein